MSAGSIRGRILFESVLFHKVFFLPFLIYFGFSFIRCLLVIQLLLCRIIILINFYRFLILNIKIFALINTDINSTLLKAHSLISRLFEKVDVKELENSQDGQKSAGIRVVGKKGAADKSTCWRKERRIKGGHSNFSI